MAAMVCHRCGRTGESETLEWSTALRDDVSVSLCGRCTRDHVRDIECKVDESWWVSDDRPVLVVEDDDDTRLLIRMSLESAGYRVDEARTGEDALRLLDGGMWPEVVIVDLGLPGVVDGWSVRDRALANGGTTWVIVISAHASPPAGQHRPHQEFLAKPFDMDMLVDLVDRRTSDQAGVGRA